MRPAAELRIPPDGSRAKQSYLAAMETIETVVIGGGQAGLAAGYHLQRQGCAFVILDARARTGDSWRQRWDSLRTFSAARYNQLDGMRFPGPGSVMPGKDQMADYLETYAEKFNLPIRHEVTVERLSHDGESFVINAADGQSFKADNVIVAMSEYQVPRLPDFADRLDRRIKSLHSSEYRNPAQLKNGPVLVVGVGNSGAEIAMDVIKTHPTVLAGKQGMVVPWRPEMLLSRLVIIHLLRFMAHHVLTVKTPMGRRMRASFGMAPLVRVKPADMVAAGVERVPRITGVRGGFPESEDGRLHDVANVIWCTGYRHGFPWIDLPVFGEHGMPEQDLGVVAAVPGLYFIGLPFIYSFSSALVTGVSRDARRVARHIALHRRQKAVDLATASAVA